MDSVDHKIGDWIFKDTQIMFDTCGEVLILGSLDIMIYIIILLL